MTHDDSYPPDDGRRRFVTGVVGGSALSATGAVGATLVNAATDGVGGGGGAVEYYAVENVDGPAPRGMPQVPLELDDEGYLRGRWPEAETVTDDNVTRTVARTEIAGETYSTEWFQYCGLQTYPGIRPDADQDDYLRHSTGGYEWQREHETGTKLHIDDLSGHDEWDGSVGRAGVGKPAQTRWRSEDLPESTADKIIPVFVLRSERIASLAADDEWLSATTVRGTIAVVNKCTHFCCVPEFQADGSAKFDAENDLYCQCHQSVYDPFSVVKRTFTALPRPE